MLSDAALICRMLHCGPSGRKSCICDANLTSLSRTVNVLTVCAYPWQVPPQKAGTAGQPAAGWKAPDPAAFHQQAKAITAAARVTKAIFRLIDRSGIHG